MLSHAISNTKPVAEGVWESDLTPEEVKELGSSMAQKAGPSIIFLSDFDIDGDATIRFAPKSVSVLNLGTSNRALLFAAIGSDTAIDIKQATSGDEDFLVEAANAGMEVEKFARHMLAEVRKLDPKGDLVKFSGRRFINKPDNFVVLVPQPRVKELKVVVRGHPNEFENPPQDLKADQNGYSTFKVRSASELENGVKLLNQVRRKF